MYVAKNRLVFRAMIFSLAIRICCHFLTLLSKYQFKNMLHIQGVFILYLKMLICQHSMRSNLGSPSLFSCQKDNCSGQHLLSHSIGVRMIFQGLKQGNLTNVLQPFFSWCRSQRKWYVCSTVGWERSYSWDRISTAQGHPTAPEPSQLTMNYLWYTLDHKIGTRDSEQRQLCFEWCTCEIVFRIIFCHSVSKSKQIHSSDSPKKIFFLMLKIVHIYYRKFVLQKKEFKSS